MLVEPTPFSKHREDIEAPHAPKPTWSGSDEREHEDMELSEDDEIQFSVGQEPPSEFGFPPPPPGQPPRYGFYIHFCVVLTCVITANTTRTMTTLI